MNGLLTLSNVHTLSQAQLNLNHTDFLRAFAGLEQELLPEHFWRQYSGIYRHNLLAFFNYLGKDVYRQALIDYLNKEAETEHV